MARWFQLELDTKAPDVTWGTPIGGEPGQLLTIPYTIDEPEIVSAVLYDAMGRAFELEVGPTELTGTMPVDQYAGPAEVRALVRDELLNQGTETLALVLSGQEVEFKEQGGGVSREFTQIGGPAFVHQTDHFEAYVQGVSLDVARVSGRVSGRRPVTREEFTGTVSAARREEIRFSAERQGNVTLAQIRQEDDEILALIG